MSRSALAKTRVLEGVQLIVHPSGWDTFAQLHAVRSTRLHARSDSPHPPEEGFGVHLNITHGSLCAVHARHCRAEHRPASPALSTPSYARAGAQPGQASMDSTVGGTCPGACHTSGIAIPEVTPEVRAATTRFYQNLGEDFIPGLGSIKLPRGGYLFSGDEASRVGGLLASAPFVGFALKR